MNDCLWAFIFCEGSCKNCNKYIGANSKLGSDMLQEYRNEVEETLKPLKLKWMDKMENWRVE